VSIEPGNPAGEAARLVGGKDFAPRYGKPTKHGSQNLRV
jgi:hypothetical protein